MSSPPAEAQTGAAAPTHPAVQAGIEKYEQADFEGTLASLDTAIRSSDLTRPDLLRLIATRALAHFALGQTEALQRDLATLVSLDPTYALGPSTPPRVQRQLAQARAQASGALGLRIQAEQRNDGTRIWVTVQNDEANLVEELRVRARVPDGDWKAGGDDGIRLTEAAPDVVEAYAWARGLGGAELVRVGTVQDPHRVAVTRRIAPAPLGAGAPTGDPLAASQWDGSGQDTRSADESDDGNLWVWLGLGALAAVGAATAAVVLTNQDDSPPTLLSPTVNWGGGDGG